MLALLVALACEVPLDTEDAKDTGAEAERSDLDGDGFTTEAGDCDDTDPAAYPGMTEDCDGIDNNCDGTVDEGFEAYKDADSDGFGDPTQPIDCEVDTGKVTNDEDCDDGDGNVHPGAEEACNDIDDDCDGDIDEGVTSTWYADADEDGFGDAKVAVEACSAPEHYVSQANDCDDTRDDAFPAAPEVCDEIDNDCDGNVDEDVTVDFYADTDDDGHGDATQVQAACALPTGYSAYNDDCDDTSASISPSASESCNGVDDDCDGTTDEPDAVDASTWYDDVDGDGFGDSRVATTACDQPYGTVANGLDCNDADPALNPGTAWYIDVDGDGYGSSGYVLNQCEWPSGYVADSTDCDDTESSVNPGAAEACNEYDDDCDGLVDDDDSPVDPSTWYADADGDNYGDETTTATACNMPIDYVSDGTDCDDTSADVSPAASELCNGIDDDCDGLVDDDDTPTDPSTWYVDTDGDGYGDDTSSVSACNQPSGTVSSSGDCDDTSTDVSPVASEAWYDGVDSDCDGTEDPSVCDSVPGASTVATDAACVASFGTSWTVATEWTTDSTSYTFDTADNYTEVMATPAVGNLTDDNGDGAINQGDVPDVVFATFKGSGYSSAGYLRLVSGDSGEEITTISSATVGSTSYSVGGTSSVALGDLEGDGSPDIVAVSTGGDILAFEADGSTKWVYDTSKSQYIAPFIADMDGDGLAEVTAGTTVLDAYGNLVSTCTAFSDGYYGLAADINADGQLDLVGGDGACELDGTVLFTSTRTTGFAAVGEFDGDAELEVVNADRSNDRVDLLDDDGTLLWSTGVSGGGGGPPVVGDFDGDGELEIGVGGATRFTVFEADGSRLWQATVDDSSSESCGATAFDFDADGALEIVYAEEGDLYIFDGASGSTLYTTTSHASGTLREEPIVVDVDRDGQAEIVLASNDYAFSGWDGIHVLGAADGEWPSARNHFNQHAYLVDTWDDDLLANDPAIAWTDWSMTRGQKGYTDAPAAVADLEVTLLGTCADCDAGTAMVYAIVDNTGLVFAPAGVTVSLYAVSGASETLLGSETLGGPVEPGDRTAPIEFSILVSDIGSDGLRAEVEGAARECDETDNVDADNDTLCP